MEPSIFIILLRLIVPLSILRWPLAGGILAMAAVASDVFVLQAFGWGLFEGDAYHRLDKLLDTYYIALECWVVLRWKDETARNVGVGLFVLRLAGLMAFEATGSRAVFLATPNIFENFYLLWLLFPRLRGRLPLLLTIAAVPKVAQEYVMHYREFPTWEYLRDALFYWIF